MENLEMLRQKILKYQLVNSELGSLGYTRILLQVCGTAGHGKSSLINSFKYALHGGKFQISAPVASGAESHGANTMSRTSYELTSVITFVDNRGFGKSDNYEKEEVYAQLANFQPLDEEVVWERSYEERMKEVTNAKLNSKDLLIPIFVYSVEQKMDKGSNKDIKEFLKTAQKLTGFLPLIVLTKKSAGDFETLRHQFNAMDMETISVVENYTANDYVKAPGKDKEFLTIISQALDLVDFVSKNVSSIGTPEEEHGKRVQMLLNMAHKNEMQKMLEAERDKWEKEHQKKPGNKFCILQ